MGRCLQIGGQPAQINIQLPGGISISSMAHATQQIPNIMDPFQSLLQGVQPALGAIQPVFDIIGFVMKLMNCQILLAKIMGALMMPLAPGNPFSALFKPPPMLDENGDPLEPYVPDVLSLAPDMLNCMAELLAGALKIAGLVPQLSVAVTIKDSVLTALAFVDAAMAQVNSLADLFTGIPAADTGNFTFDLTLACAGDNASLQLEHKLGPVSNLVPLMSVLSLLAQAASQPLPSVIYDMAKILADAPPEGFGLVPFPDLSGAPINGPTPDEQRQQLLDVIEEMTISGLPIEIPDFSDLSNLGTLLQELQSQLDPVLPAIELVQSVIDKLTKT